MEKKTVSKYLTWFLALAAVAFALAGWYYTGGAQKVEGFFGGSADNNALSTSEAAGSCSVGTCG